MRRLAIALAVLAVAGVLVFPSAAAPLTTDSIDESVHLAPADSANGDYARVEDGELVVDLTAANPNVDGEGVNADGVTRLSAVFEIQYNGSQYAHVWITHGSDDVTLTARGESIQSQADNVTLGPNESVTVGLVVDTRGSDPTDGLVDDMEVNALLADPESESHANSLIGASDETTVELTQPSDTERSIEITNPPTDESITVDLDGLHLVEDGSLTLDELRVTASEDDDVELDLSTTTAETGDEQVHALGSFEVREESGSVERATFRFSADRTFLDEQGIAPEQLTVLRTSDGETDTLPVTVVSADDDEVVFEAETAGVSTFTVAAFQPAIDVTAADLSTDAVETNENATVTARLDNDGRAAGNRTVTLTLDGDPVAERTVSVEAGGSTTVTFDVAPTDAGEYEVAVDGVVAGTLTVADPATTADGIASAGRTATADGTVTTDERETADRTATGDDTRTAAPVEEPAGLGLQEVLGLTLLLAILGTTFVLVRRAPR